MKRPSLLLLSLVLWALPCLGQSELVGKSAPAIVAHTVLQNDGREALAAHLGDLVLIEFFSTT